MKKLLAFLLIFLLCVSSFTNSDYAITTKADDEDVESIILNELVVTTTYETAISQQIQTLTAQTDNVESNVNFQGGNVTSAECLYTVNGDSSATNSIETFLSKPKRMKMPRLCIPHWIMTLMLFVLNIIIIWICVMNMTQKVAFSGRWIKSA